MVAGRANYVENLKTMFPDDHEAIDKFMHILDVSSSHRSSSCLVSM